MGRGAEKRFNRQIMVHCGSNSINTFTRGYIINISHSVFVELIIKRIWIDQASTQFSPIALDLKSGSLSTEVAMVENQSLMTIMKLSCNVSQFKV
jgi:hypothetical protein